ncbi:MAG: zinc metallopeptidase [Pseudomonadota bacterium]
MLYALLAAVISLLVFGPQLWVRLVMRRHGETLPNMPGTGAELARHLIKRFELADISVEETAPGTDHFDPGARAVRLSPDNYHGKSITAIAVAAHEVGHAIQFHRAEPIFRLRSRYLPRATALRKLGILVLSGVPLIALLFKAPAAIGAMIALGVILQLIGALTYLIVLPEEWDASFNKALPLLAGGYVPQAYEPQLRQVLTAAALTYFAGALADLLNIGRWLLVLRR